MKNPLLFLTGGLWQGIANSLELQSRVCNLKLIS